MIEINPDFRLFRVFFWKFSVFMAAKKDETRRNRTKQDETRPDPRPASMLQDLKESNSDRVHNDFNDSILTIDFPDMLSKWV